jgi:2-oxoglutarate ferredoxin oxidoreductase subunit beta
VDYDPGTTASVRMHDGSQMRLRKLDRDYDATNKVGALQLLAASHEKGEMLTGVFYVNATAPSFIEQLNLSETSLARMPEELTRPSRQALDEIMEELR